MWSLMGNWNCNFLWFSVVYNPWLDYLGDFSIMQCHSVQCVSKCARPVCSSAPQTACQASGWTAFVPGGAAFSSITAQQVDKSSGQERRWKYTHERKLDESPNQVRSNRGNLAVAYFPLEDLLMDELTVCGSTFFFRLNTNRMEVVIATQRMWIYNGNWCQVSKREREECRLNWKTRTADQRRSTLQSSKSGGWWSREVDYYYYYYPISICFQRNISNFQCTTSERLVPQIHF